MRAQTGIITDIVPEIFYNAPHPREPIADLHHAGFTVRARVHLWSPGGIDGTLIVTGGWGAHPPSGSVRLALPAGAATAVVNVSATAAQIRLWQPAGNGEQPLYNLSVSLRQGPAAVEAVRRVGFRVVSLVTTNDTDGAAAAADAGREGSGGHGMLFRVNGRALFAKGANVIPMDNMEVRAPP